MSKTIENLILRAEKKGFAKVNGRKSGWYGGRGELQEKYSVTIENGKATLKHWGTVTAVVDIENEEVIEIYGESVSDRDSVNYFLSYFDLPYHVHYYPSREEFELHEDMTEKVLRTI